MSLVEKYFDYSPKFREIDLQDLLNKEDVKEEAFNLNREIFNTNQAAINSLRGMYVPSQFLVDISQWQGQMKVKLLLRTEEPIHEGHLRHISYARPSIEEYWNVVERIIKFNRDNYTLFRSILVK